MQTKQIPIEVMHIIRGIPQKFQIGTKNNMEVNNAMQTLHSL